MLDEGKTQEVQVRKHILWAGFVSALFVPAAASAKAPTPQHIARYEHLYHADVQANGKRDPGCKLVGAQETCHQKVTDVDVTTSIEILQRALTPPPAPASYTSNAPAQSTVYPSSYQPRAVQSAQGSTGGLPYCTWGPESGGNWSAVNPSSGAGGRYQIMPSTWAANGGSGSPQNASPAEQTAIAQKIYAGGAGASQWVNC